MSVTDQSVLPSRVSRKAWANASPTLTATTGREIGSSSTRRLRAEGRIVYVDFTARWCATCQANKKLVFHNDEVLKTFAAKKVALLRGDWTSRDAAITKELAAYNRSAVPFNVIWLPGKTEPKELPEALTPGAVLEAVR